MIEIIYALPETAYRYRVPFTQGLTLEQALTQAGVLTYHPEIDFSTYKVGVFSQLKALDELLCPGDRLEIYRPLTADPKEIRKRRAQQKNPSGEL